MPVKRKTTDEAQDMESILEGQLPEATEEVQTEEEFEFDAAKVGRVGQKLLHNVGGHDHTITDEDRELVANKRLSRLGDNIRENVEIRDGWMHMEKELLGERAQFYPENWEFWIRPATVDAIRNWSTVDEENVVNVDDVFNEILKYCLSIKTPTGPQPWSAINSWDKFFFVLMVREYTFKQGEQNIQFDEDCVNCDSPIIFKLDTQALMYDLPDTETISKYYDPQTRSWLIDPEEFDIPENPITLYNPTVDKDANIKAWLIARYQENRNYKAEGNFIKYLSWLAPKISKDPEVAKRQIREYQLKYKSWDMDMFTFMEDVIRNITITPSTSIRTICPACGEEVTTPIRFPNGVSDLFNINRRQKRFGPK